MSRKYRDSDWLEAQYLDNERSQQDIADECGVSQSVISEWIDKHNIDKRTRSESMQIFSVGNEGWEMPEEMRENLSEMRKGENNPNWKNGEWTDEKKDFRDTKKWETFSRNIKEDKDWTCENCGQYGGELHTHHANPVSDGGEKWDNTFIVLCYNCHQGDYTFWHNSSVEEQLETIAR
jgi:predicted transcriptional regulator